MPLLPAVLIGGALLGGMALGLQMVRAAGSTAGRVVGWACVAVCAFCVAAMLLFALLVRVGPMHQ